MPEIRRYHVYVTKGLFIFDGYEVEGTDDELHFKTDDYVYHRIRKEHLVRIEEHSIQKRENEPVYGKEE